MKATFAKIDANTIQITTMVVPQEVVQTYVYDDLVSILTGLQAQKDAFNTDIDQKIADAQANLDAADGLDIVALPVLARPVLTTSQQIAL